MKKPIVSVIMGCYNDSLYLRESIESILNQTLQDFEFIIIDDCSNDNSVEIVKSYKDSRIKIIQNEKNMGLGYNLNVGVSLSCGKFIARMDADDISMPTRFERQVAYLEAHPDIFCLGTSAKKIGNIGLRARLFSRKMNQKTDYEAIKVAVLFGTPMLHPSVMFNGSILRDNNINYNPNVRRAQDYELWSRTVWDYKFANLKDYLLCYRYSQTQASSSDREKQLLKSRDIHKYVLNKIFNIEPTEDQLISHSLFIGKSILSESDLVRVAEWITELQKHVKGNRYLSERAFTVYVAKRWAVICRNSCNLANRRKFYMKLPFVKTFFSKNIIRLYSRL